MYFRNGSAAAVFQLEIISEIMDKRPQLCNLFRVRGVVGPVQKGRLHPVKMFGHRLVCQKHKVFYNVRCRVSCVSLHQKRRPVLIQRDFALRKIKINGTSRLSLFPHNIRKLFHKVKHGGQLFKFFRSFLIAFQNTVDVRIAHSLINDNHALRYLIVNHISLFIDGHKTTESETFLPLIEGTDSVGKCVGQHGNHSVHQINAGSPLPCLPVQGGIFLHVIGNVRNVHAKEILIIPFGKTYRVVQILCVLAVNGDHRKAAKVLAARLVVFAHWLCNTGRLIQHLFRKFHGNVKPLYNGQNIHSRVVYMP